MDGKREIESSDMCSNLTSYLRQTICYVYIKNHKIESNFIMRQNRQLLQAL